MAARVLLRIAEFDIYTSLKGWRTDEQKARHIGVDPATLHRIRRGKTTPGAHFIARTLAAFPELEFHRLFRIQPGNERHAKDQEGSEQKQRDQMVASDLLTSTVHVSNVPTTAFARQGKC